jgi:hypothetical protein
MIGPVLKVTDLRKAYGAIQAVAASRSRSCPARSSA